MTLIRGPSQAMADRHFTSRSMPQFVYDAVRVRQTPAGKWLVLFGAPATQIERWSGIPQKQELEGQETTGFQREENEERIKKLGEFYSNANNIVQNPLLCAIRDTSGGSVRFEVQPDAPDDGRVQLGKVIIEAERLEERSLLDLLRGLMAELERRVPALANHVVSEELVLRLKRSAEFGVVEEADEDIVDDEDDDAEPESDDGEHPEAVLFEDSHISDFWEEVAARVRVLQDLAPGDDLNSFAGFSKEAIISFLRPIVLVDGQHRLRGAVQQARQLAGTEQYIAQIEEALAQERDAREVQEEVEDSIARILPLSLLMTSDPAEHVFQFIVVNQKATPLGRALLGTIVATTLATEETQRVSGRLRQAGIPLEQSQVIAYLSRSPDSPFRGLVERGLVMEGNLLPWTVLGSLVRIFRDLKGGRLFGEKNDYADRWRREFLPMSPLVDGWEAAGFSSPAEYWAQPDGPWREVFVRFWREIQDYFGQTADPEAPNYWGDPRHSHLFNKISLTILAADFFRFLCEIRRTIESVDEVPALVRDEWLLNVDPRYFNRSWPLEGVKKDSTGIRNKWAQLWDQYRKNPVTLPRMSEYRKPARTG